MKTFYVQEPHVDGTKIYNPGDKREADENEVKHLVDLKVLGDKPPKQASTGEKAGAPDYEADKLADKPLDKATKDELLVIAAYEKADVPEGDKATVAQLRAAIDAKRTAA